MIPTGSLIASAIIVGLYLIVHPYPLTPPPVPSRKATRQRLANELLEHLRGGAEPVTIVEIGTGWGHLAATTADTLTAAGIAHCIASYEIGPLQRIVARLRLRHHPTVSVIAGSGFAALEAPSPTRVAAVIGYLTPFHARRGALATLSAAIAHRTTIFYGSVNFPVFPLDAGIVALTEDRQARAASDRNFLRGEQTYWYRCAATNPPA